MNSLTTEFYEEILKTHDQIHVKINRIETENACGKWENFMSNVQLVKLYGYYKNEDYYKSIIIKTLPPMEHMILYRSHIAMENEVNAYTKIIPALNRYSLSPLPFPTCIYADSETIILENLCEVGYKAVGTKTGGLSLRQCEIVVKVLAKLHAASVKMQHEDPEGFKNLTYLTKEILFSETDSDLLNHQTSSIENAIQMMKEFSNSAKHKKAVKILLDIKQNSREEIKNNILNPGSLSVFCHGDCWSGNIMFNENNDLKLIDVQIMRCNSIATDLMHLFYTNLLPETQHAHEERLLKCYLEELHENLNDKDVKMSQMVTEDWLSKEISKWRLYGFVWAIWTLPIYFPEEIENNNKIPNNSRYKIRLKKLILNYVDRLE